MAGIDTAIDHIGVVGRDLTDLEQRFATLGFRIAPRCELVAVADDGSTTPMNQHNSHLVFANSYVELTAVTGSLSGHHLEQALSRYFGLHIAVLLSKDATADNAGLQALGYHPTKVGVAGRSIDYPSGKGMGLFRWFRIPDAEAPEAYFCFVEHLTPELVFDPKLNDHPNGATELSGFTICVDNPAQSATSLARMCGASIRRNQGGTDIVMRRGTITVTDRERGHSLYGGANMPTPPFAMGFTVDVDTLEKPAACLAEAGIPFIRNEDSLLVVPDVTGQPFVRFALKRS